MTFTREAMDALERYRWPGNVRELVNVAEYVVALTRGETVDIRDLPVEVAAAPLGAAGPRAVGPGEEARSVRAALERHRWHRIEAAAELGVDRVTLYRMMKRHGIQGPRGRRRKPGTM